MFFGSGGVKGVWLFDLDQVVPQVKVFVLGRWGGGGSRGLRFGQVGGSRGVPQVKVFLFGKCG